MYLIVFFLVFTIGYVSFKLILYFVVNIGKLVQNNKSLEAISLALTYIFYGGLVLHRMMRCEWWAIVLSCIAMPVCWCALFIVLGVSAEMSGEKDTDRYFKVMPSSEEYSLWKFILLQIILFFIIGTTVFQSIMHHGNWGYVGAMALAGAMTSLAQFVVHKYNLIKK